MMPESDAPVNLGRSRLLSGTAMHGPAQQAGATLGKEPFRSGVGLSKVTILMTKGCEVNPTLAGLSFYGTRRYA